MSLKEQDSGTGWKVRDNLNQESAEILNWPALGPSTSELVLAHGLLALSQRWFGFLLLKVLFRLRVTEPLKIGARYL